MATPAATSRPLRALERSAKPYLSGCSRRRRWSGSQRASWASAPLAWMSSLAPPSSGRGQPRGGAGGGLGGRVLGDGAPGHRADSLTLERTIVARGEEATGVSDSRRGRAA